MVEESKLFAAAQLLKGVGKGQKTLGMVAQINTNRGFQNRKRFDMLCKNCRKKDPKPENCNHCRICLESGHRAKDCKKKD